MQTHESALPLSEPETAMPADPMVDALTHIGILHAIDNAAMRHAQWIEKQDRASFNPAFSDSKERATMALLDLHTLRTASDRRTAETKFRYEYGDEADALIRQYDIIENDIPLLRAKAAGEFKGPNAVKNIRIMNHIVDAVVHHGPGSEQTRSILHALHLPEESAQHVIKSLKWNIALTVLVSATANSGAGMAAINPKLGELITNAVTPGHSYEYLIACLAANVGLNISMLRSRKYTPYVAATLAYYLSKNTAVKLGLTAVGSLLPSVWTQVTTASLYAVNADQMVIVRNIVDATSLVLAPVVIGLLQNKAADIPEIEGPFDNKNGTPEHSEAV